MKITKCSTKYDKPLNFQRYCCILYSISSFWFSSTKNNKIIFHACHRIKTDKMHIWSKCLLTINPSFWYDENENQKRRNIVQNTSSQSTLSISLARSAFCSHFSFSFCLTSFNCFVWVSLFIDFSLCFGVHRDFQSAMARSYIQLLYTIHTCTHTHTHEHIPNTNDCCNAFFLYIMYIVSCTEFL